MKNILLLIFIFIGTQVLAQDVLFTQYASSPLTLNPANTGLVNGDMRVSANYRNDWNSVAVPFITSTISYDMALLKGKLNGSSLGIGLLGVQSQSGDGNTENISTGVSVAYHQKLNNNSERPHTLSIGVQALYLQKMFQIFEWDLPYISVYEVEIEPYLDYNVGLMYSGYINSRSTIYGGMAINHFREPIEIYEGGARYISARVSAMLGGSYKLNEKFNLYYSGTYQQQGKASDVVVGGAVGILLNGQQKDDAKSMQLYLGSWYRSDNAIAPYVGFEKHKIRIGCSYDINTSSLTEATEGTGAIELSLIYNGKFGRNRSFASNQSIPTF